VGAVGMGAAMGGMRVGGRLCRHYSKRGYFRDGRIFWRDFEPLCHAIGWNTQQALAMWYQADLNRSGSLSQYEFELWCNRPDVAPYIERMEAQKAWACQIPVMSSPVPQPMPLYQQSYPMHQPQPMPQPTAPPPYMHQAPPPYVPQQYMQQQPMQQQPMQQQPMQQQYMQQQQYVQPMQQHMPQPMPKPMPQPMMGGPTFCGKCGSAGAVGNAFCVKCGQRL